MVSRKIILVASIIAAISIGMITYNIGSLLPASTVMAIGDDMIAYDPNAPHYTFHSKAGINNFYNSLKTNHIHGLIGVVQYHVKRADGTTSDTWSTNTRTVEGINCALQILFNPNNGAALTTNSSNSDCVGNGSATGSGTGMILTSTTHFNGFNAIVLINRTGTTANGLNGSDTVSRDATYGDVCKCGGSAAGGRASAADGALAKQNGGLTNEGGPLVSTVAGTSTYNQITITSPSYGFTNSSGMTITGVFLTNSTHLKMSAFAENSFTGVVLASGDTLTITWTITLT